MKKIVTGFCLLSFVLFSTKSIAMPQYDECGCECAPRREVYLPCSSNTFNGEFTALYLQPYGSNMHYVAEAQPLPAPTPNWVINDLRPDYHFGFDLGVSANIDARAAKVAFNWTHFYSSDSASKGVSTSDMLGPFFEIGPDALLYNNAKGTSVYHYDALNLDYGFLVNFGDCFHTTFYSGIAGARIKQDLKTGYSNDDRTVARTIKTPSSFLGAGPQLGVDCSADIFKGLQLTGGGSAALLVGKLKNHTTYKSVSPFLIPLNITPPNTQSTTVNDRTSLIPALEGRIGLAYEAELCNFLVALEAGYEARIYFDAIQSVDMGSEVVTPPVVPDTVGVFARTFQRNKSNFALAGPYLRLSIGF